MIGSGSEYFFNLKKRAIVRRMIHPKYDSSNLDYDAGVVKVETPFVVSAVEKPIALVAANEHPPTWNVSISGWGKNNVSAHSSGIFVKSVLKMCS